MINQNVIEIIGKAAVKINGVKVDVECPKCQHRWGVYLNEVGKLPYRWDYCIKCAERRSTDVLAKLSLA